MLRRSKPLNPETAAQHELDRRLNHLLRRSRRVKAIWELFDGRNENRPHLLNWGTFRHSYGNKIFAITPVELNGRTWWVVAERQPKPITFAEILAGGLMGMLFTLGSVLYFEFWSVDPRTLDKPVWEPTPGVKRAYIKTREDLAKLS